MTCGTGTSISCPVRHINKDAILLTDCRPDGRHLRPNFLLLLCHRRRHASIAIPVPEEAPTSVVLWALRGMPTQRNCVNTIWDHCKNGHFSNFRLRGGAWHTPSLGGVAVFPSPFGGVVFLLLLWVKLRQHRAQGEEKRNTTQRRRRPRSTLRVTPWPRLFSFCYFFDIFFFLSTFFFSVYVLFSFFSLLKRRTKTEKKKKKKKKHEKNFSEKIKKSKKKNLEKNSTELMTTYDNLPKVRVPNLW